MRYGMRQVSSRARRQWRLALVVAIAACGGSGTAADDSVGTRARDSTASASASDSSSQRAANLPRLSGWGKARPVDEAGRDTSLRAFRDTLLAIAERRDSAALHARISPTINFSFGDSGGGAAGFFAHWRQYESMDAMWKTLTDVLSHGGRMVERGFFYAPWTGQALPDSLDAFEFLVVRDSNVVVRAAPDISDGGFGTLSYDIVRAGGDRADSAWRGIRLPDARVGYVEAEHIRSPLDYRIGLRRHGSRWMIDFFVAGD